MTAISYDAPARAKRTRGPWARRLLLGTAAALAIATAGFAGYAAIAKATLAAANPPPGTLYDVGGHRLHLDCTGDGGTTILLEAGNADFSVHWAAATPLLAEHGRVCAYDRAGLGWSETAPSERTLATMTAELGALLDAAGIDGRIVVVAHSFGTAVARSFAAQHPERVAGLVLVDPAHEEQLHRLPAMAEAVAAGEAQFKGLVPLATFGLLAMMPGAIPNRGLPAEAHDRYAAVLATTGYFSAAAVETAAMPENLDALAATGTSLGDLPLVVISRGQPEPLPGITAEATAAFEAEWRAMQTEIAGLSTRSRHVIADGSGHYVQLSQPELVADAVASLLGRR